MTGEDIIKVRDVLRSQRSPMVTHWNELAPLYTPFDTVDVTSYSDILSASRMFDSTPQQAAQICANGLASLIFPREEDFAEYQPPLPLQQDDQAISWCRKCSAIHRQYLQNSNFWEEMQEALIELPVFGTTCLFIGDLDDETDELYFKHIPIGTYNFTEDSKGRPNSMYRDLEYTADQAIQEFGEENLPKEITSKAGKSQGVTEKFCFTHYVGKRTYKNKEDPTNLQKPWKSCVVYDKTKKVVQEDGFDDFPFAIIRFRKLRKCVWGFGSGWLALGDSRQINLLNQLADVATEISVFPPSVVPSYMEGEVDMGPLGINYRDQNDQNSSPIQQLPIQNRLDTTYKRLDDKRSQINDAFFVDLFKLFSQRAMDRAPLTATEAGYIANEKLTQFSPVYGRIVSEGGDVLMRRNFSSLFTKGKFPPPPASMLDENGNTAIPSVLYKNKIVLAQQMKKNGSLLDFFNIVIPLLQVTPEIGPLIQAGLNLPTAFRSVARNTGFPEEWLKSEEEMNEALAAMADAAQRQQQAALMEQGSKTAANMGKAPPEMAQAIAGSVT